MPFQWHGGPGALPNALIHVVMVWIHLPVTEQHANGFPRRNPFFTGLQDHDWPTILRLADRQVSLQLSTEDFYRDFPSRSVPADVHGILLRVASLDDTLAGKIKAWRTPERRPSKTIKDLGDIARLIEAHPNLTASLPADVSQALCR